MICQECNERPATLHFTKINNGEKTVFHLCERCAQEKGDTFIMNAGSAFSFNHLLAGLLSMEDAFKPAQQTPLYHEEIKQCSECSMTFKQFVEVGRFGCARCYEAFEDQIKPILRRLHSSNYTHNGKIPARIGGDIHLRKNIEQLKQQIIDLVSHEEFEKAAEIRDQIRLLEKQLADRNGVGGE